jgi:hypothetical protein
MKLNSLRTRDHVLRGNAWVALGFQFPEVSENATLRAR